MMLCEIMGLKERDPKTLPGLALAYVGDAVFEMVVRTTLVESGLTHVGDLNRIATGIVNAKAQAALIGAIEDTLGPDEHNAFRRGKNVNSTSVPKSATRIEYHLATGFEALIGYLYLEGKMQRIMDICAPVLENIPQVKKAQEISARGAEDRA